MGNGGGAVHGRQTNYVGAGPFDMFEATLLEYGYISATANDAFSNKLDF